MRSGKRCRTAGAGRARRRAVAATSLLIATAGALAAPAADARVYTVWSCRGPAWETLGIGGWQTGAANARAGDVVFADACGRQGPMSVSLAPGRRFDAPVTGSLTFQTPPGTRIAGSRSWRSLAVAEPQLLGFSDFTAGSVESTGGGAAVVSGCSTRASTCRAAGDAGDPDSSANLAGEQQAPLDAVGLQVGCGRAQCARPDGIPAVARLHRASIEVDDPHAPTAVLVGGLAEDRPAWGPTDVQVAASDRGAGIAAMTFSVDGRRVRSATFAHAPCREPYDRPQPCPGDAVRTFSLDTAALEPGHHLASGTVVDAAGNVSDWYLPFEVRRPTEGARPPGTDTRESPAGTAVSRAPRLRLGRRLFEHRPGRAATIRGRLRTRAGEPVPRARLTVTAIDIGLSERRRARRWRRTVTTDRGGRFAVRLRRDGAQRVTVTYSPQPGVVAATASATARARLTVTARPSARTLTKGRGLTLRGRLRGAGRSALGALVHVEAIVNGRWSPVGVARARADGRWSWRYRFVHLTRDTIFAFRAVVRGGPGWPWPARRARTLRVRVNVP
jgi:hypothetical protein